MPYLREELSGVHCHDDVAQPCRRDETLKDTAATDVTDLGLALAARACARKWRGSGQSDHDSIFALPFLTDAATLAPERIVYRRTETQLVSFPIARTLPSTEAARSGQSDLYCAPRPLAGLVSCAPQRLQDCST